MEHQVEITVSEHGRDPDAGDRLIGAFKNLDPKTDAVVEQNTRTGVLSATFFLDAEDATEAVRVGGDLFVEAALDASLSATRVLAVRGVACAEASDDALVPA